ncbi:MAG TPA: hypothetical protein VFV70_00125 [Hyphomonadaceae bacterium]|nr:hypothetical protein [Hyphomonadaceae bacterium]
MRFALVALAGLALAAAPASALTVEAKISAEFQTKLEDDYGVREAKILTDSLASKVEAAFARHGVRADRVVVTIQDARPNRPTMQQISDTPGLDPMRSISVGGARVTGTAFDDQGTAIGTLEYDWYETDLANVIASTTWSDARWSFDRFARRFADRLNSTDPG